MANPVNQYLVDLILPYQGLYIIEASLNVNAFCQKIYCYLLLLLQEDNLGLIIFGQTLDLFAKHQPFFASVLFCPPFLKSHLSPFFTLE